MATPISSRTRGNIQGRLCVGCGGQIHDQYILRVAPNLEWHAACLKCCQCQKVLDENCTCFVREGKIFCKDDYVRLFGTKCEKCSRSFGPNDFVMRAKNKIFHLECFRCVACDKQLVPGDEFALRQEGLFCKKDHATSSDNIKEENNNEQNDDLDQGEEDDEDHNVDGDKSDEDKQDRLTDSGMDDLGSEKSPCSSVGGNLRHDTVTSSDSGKNSTSSQQHQQQRRSRAGRVRTVLTEKQLSLLKSCYSANPRPDALMKEQLVEMTGLSPRVVRVWFQNKRCKDKKKLSMQKSKEGRKLGYGGMHGVPMVASSPLRHELAAGSSPGGQGMNPVDVHTYEPPWKALCDFALHSDLDRLQYNNLTSQMHGYDDYNRGGHPGMGPYHPQPHLMEEPGLLPTSPYEGDCTTMAGRAQPDSNGGYTLTSLDNTAVDNEA